MKLSFTVTRDKAAVAAFLTDPDKFVSVHPIIYKMEKLGAAEYRIFEKVKMGFFSYSFVYKASINSDAVGSQVKMLGNVMGMTKIEMTFTLSSVPDGTLVTEDVSIRTFLPVKKFMFRLIEEQHTLMFQNIEKQK